MDLERALGSVVTGPVRFDGASRALFATDASNYRHVPIAVVQPRTVDEVVAAVGVCHDFGAPILSRGAGTSLAGQACNEAVIIDHSRFLRAVTVDASARTATVEPGVVLDDLRAAAAPHGMTFGPDPATHRWCTLGGMIGNNACGVHSLTTGRTSDNVVSLDVLMPDGRRLTVGEGPTGDAHVDKALLDLLDRHGEQVRDRFPPIPRRVSGYNLDELLPTKGFNVARSLVGSEGTCVVVLGATVALTPAPAARALLIAGYPSIVAAAEDVGRILSRGPIGLEALDRDLIRDAPFPEGDAWLLAEFGGDTVTEAAERGASAMRARDVLHTDPIEIAKAWAVREAALATGARVNGTDRWAGWEDAAVAPAKLAAYLRAFADLLDDYGYRTAMYGHFGEGCVHSRIDFDLTTTEGIADWRAFLGDAAALVTSFGGSLSGEHGDGQARGDLLPIMFGEQIVDAFKGFKAVWDPRGMMNPGRIVDPAPVTADLRLGAGYVPAAPKTHFAFAEDGGSIGRAADRCVGVGKCIRTETGLMCPSYQVTKEEMHSTRGRAHLLGEMLQGSLLVGADDVSEALDLCLSCKGCKVECPAGVDIAALKAEFMATRPRARGAFVFGNVARWARIGSRAPRLANAVARTDAFKRMAGIAAGRRMPALTRAPRLRAPQKGREPVILWTDTFSMRFRPDVVRAAVRVLDAAGFDVVLPPETLCCGRPYYEWGMLDEARRSLEQIVAWAGGDAPIVGLEPGCLSVFADELPDLLPTEEARMVSRRAITFARFVTEHAPDLALRALDRDAVVMPHCHARAVLDFGAEVDLLGRIGVRAKVLDVGCCGMAGAFGFQAEHHDVSVAIAEHRMLPALRATSPETLVVADGFSCREQIEQLAGRTTVHIAELVADALPTHAFR